MALPVDNPNDPFMNSKHEAFAQDVARGMDWSKAYGKAGYIADAGNAAKLYRKLIDRITILKREFGGKLNEAAEKPILAAAKERAEHFVASQSYALDLLYDIAEMASGRRTVKRKEVFRPGGKDENGAKRPPMVVELESNLINLPAAINAAKLIGEAAGLWDEKAAAADSPAEAPIKTMEDDLAVEMLEGYRQRREERKRLEAARVKTAQSA